jgi:hypothetical protein
MVESPDADVGAATGHPRDHRAGDSLSMNGLDDAIRERVGT